MSGYYRSVCQVTRHGGGLCARGFPERYRIPCSLPALSYPPDASCRAQRNTANCGHPPPWSNHTVMGPTPVVPPSPYPTHPPSPLAHSHPRSPTPSPPTPGASRRGSSPASPRSTRSWTPSSSSRWGRTGGETLCTAQQVFFSVERFTAGVHALFAGAAGAPQSLPPNPHPPLYGLPDSTRTFASFPPSPQSTWTIPDAKLKAAVRNVIKQVRGGVGGTGCVGRWRASLLQRIYHDGSSRMHHCHTSDRTVSPRRTAQPTCPAGNALHPQDALPLYSAYLAADARLQPLLVCSVLFHPRTCCRCTRSSGSATPTWASPRTRRSTSGGRGQDAWWVACWGACWGTW